jgi:fructose-bisphosphate aldolase class 1
MDQDEVKKQADEAIRKYLATLNIDDDVILSQVIKAALVIPGIRDVREVSINDRKENLVIKTDEKAEVRILEIFTGE